MSKAATKTKPEVESEIAPLGDRVLVTRAETDSVTPGGIIVPESAKEKPREGTVIALGEGRTLDNGERSTFSVKVGDRVLFTSYGGTEVKFGGKDYLIMDERDILGIVRKPARAWKT